MNHVLRRPFRIFEAAWGTEYLRPGATGSIGASAHRLEDDMSEYSEVAGRIVRDVGGLENIQKVTHCFTRLRFKLANPELVNEGDLRSLKQVAGFVSSGGTYQVVIGNEIEGVYQAVRELVDGGEPAGSPRDHDTTQKDAKESDARATASGARSLPSEGALGFLRYWGGKVMNTMSATITPILPGLVVTGLFKAFVSIFALAGMLDTSSQTYALLNMMGDAFFYFMPFLVAWSASLHFSCNSVVSMMLVGILMHPTFVTLVGEGNPISFFGLPVHAISYSSSLLPALITVWVQSKVEKLVNASPIRKLGLLLSQLPVFIVMAPLTLVVTGPIGSIAGEIIANAMLSLYQNYYFLGVFLVCFLMPLFILTGSHWVFMPTALSNLQTLGFDPFLWVGFAVINFSQLGVSFAIFLKAKSRDLKSFAGSAVLPIATAGITEPCMFGLTLKLKKPLIATFIGCAAGGVYCALVQMKVFQLVTVSLLSLPQFVDPAGGSNFVFSVIGLALVFAVTFAATWIIGFDEKDFEN